MRYIHDQVILHMLTCLSPTPNLKQQHVSQEYVILKMKSSCPLATRENDHGYPAMNTNI